MRKVLLLSISFFISANILAGTCTSLSRNNYSANSILTSSSLNADFNQLVSAHNAFDGGCITDGTLEFAAIDTSEWGPVLNAIQQGCKVSFSNASTISISKCRASVNGSFVSTTSATTASFGCTGCSTEASDTKYYVYIKTGSSGTTINPLISTTAPNDDGYDGSNNKVLASFYNNGSSDIDQYSIDQWLINRFVPHGHNQVSYTPSTQGFGTISNVECYYSRDGQFMDIDCTFTSGTVTASEARVNLPSGYTLDDNFTNRKVAGMVLNGLSSTSHGGPVLIDSGNAYLNFGDGITFGGGTATSTNLANGNTYSSSAAIKIVARVPIKGWEH